MVRLFRSISLVFAAFLSITAHAIPPIEHWISSETTVACELMLRNISPAGAALGAVVASPSRQDPNYFYHWVRDGALVMDTVVELYKREPNGPHKNFYYSLLMDYWRFSRSNQTTSTKTGLGEPKFNADGSAFNDDWGRPQNDGPALRASTFIKMAHAFMENGLQELAQELYTAKLPAVSVIKADLEYVSHHWQDASVDLWEEIRGDHFYNRMVQRKSLLEGANLAKQFNDLAAATWYEEQARLLEVEILKHWDPIRKTFVTTLNHDRREHAYKDNPLDAALLLGILHGATPDNFLNVSDDRVISTIHQLMATFLNLYSVNQNGAPGIAMGRYPQDLYFGGNPWVLITHASAEYHFKLAAEFKKQKSITITELNLPFFQSLVSDQNLRNTLQVGARFSETDSSFKSIAADLVRQGDAMLQRVQFHAPANGSLAEQIHKDSGFMTSAVDLTWNYASFLTAIWARDSIIHDH